jgi:hypothetical protein
VYDGLEPHDHYGPQQDTNNPIPIKIMKDAGCTTYVEMRRKSEKEQNGEMLQTNPGTGDEK